MPVAARRRIIERDDHDVSRANADLLIATGAHVGLACLVGLDAPDLGEAAAVWVVSEARDERYPVVPGRALLLSST